VKRAADVAESGGLTLSRIPAPESRIPPLDNITHTLVAFTLARTPVARAGPGVTAALVLASNAPDVDIVSAFTGGGVSYLAAHRGPTHGPLGVVALGVAVAALVGLSARRVRFVPILAVATMGVFLHVLMDLATSYGTRLLSPFDWTWFAVDLLPIIDVYLWGILGIGLLLGTVLSRARSRIAFLTLAVVAGHYGVRAWAHGVAFDQALGSSPATRECGVMARWRNAGGPQAANRCVEAHAALPTFGSPFRWRLVRRLPSGYELADYDVLTGRMLAYAWHPTEHSRSVAFAREARAARVFLAFARFPAARTIAGPGGTFQVRWDDMRFVGGLTRLEGDPPGGRSAFTALVTLDRQDRVIGEQLGQ